MKVVQDEDLKFLFNRFDVSCLRDDSSCSSDSSSGAEAFQRDEAKIKKRILERINVEVEFF
jgi:hypothetical protein